MTNGFLASSGTYVGKVKLLFQRQVVPLRVESPMLVFTRRTVAIKAFMVGGRVTSVRATERSAQLRETILECTK